MQASNRLKIIAQHISKEVNDQLVLFQSKDSIATVTLNKPKTLNSLNLEMIRNITEQLNFINSHQIAWFQGNGGKAFCSGGDVKVLFMNGAIVSQILQFFRQEFTLDYRLATMNAVQVACWDGIVMGGGAGLSAFAPIIIATQKTVFAMPQAKLGFFTDVGINYLLCKLRNNIGYYLGLTGARLKGEDTFIAGLANFYIPSQKLKQAYQDIANSKIIREQTDRNGVIAATAQILKKYHSPSGRTKIDNQDCINTLFSLPSAKLIYETALGKNDQFHKGVIKLLEEQCPVSVELILRLIKRSKNLTLRQIFILDFQIIEHMAVSSDFREGVRCLLIQKGKMPKWSAASIPQIKQEQVTMFLKPIEDSRPLLI